MSERAARFRAMMGTSLNGLVAAGRAECIATGLRWGEGPAYVEAWDAWVFSDIPNNRMLSWSRRQGLVTFRSPSNFANGNSVSADGALLTCEHGSRSVVRTEKNGACQVLCSEFDGRRLNSPNDLVEHPDGSVWFSDPTYGILSNVEGYRAPSEQSANRVYRRDARTGELSAQVSALRQPNGLCFSPDHRTLYVADSGADMGPDVPFDENGPREVHAFALLDGRVASAGRVFARASKGVPDGIRCDDDGYLWVCTGLGLECFDPQGRLVGVIETPETASNLCFGGADGTSLLIALASSAYIVSIETH
ncbi:MAG TPA: SMP-30/gluconolactonase/LRE family protein [Steroidobacter sp.]